MGASPTTFGIGVPTGKARTRTAPAEKVGNAGPPPTVTNKWLDEGIQKLLPTHMQLIMGVGSAEEFARAEVKAEELMAKTLVLGSEEDAP